MHQVFLDSNTYLAFYSLAPKDIAELSKVADLLEMKRLTLLLPSQVIGEVKRNRAKVIYERVKPLQDARLQVSIPEMAIGTPTADALKACVAETQRAHSILVEELQEAATQRTMPADVLIDRLFKSASVLSEAGAVDGARRRKEIGNPPGKGASLGDGVNWEILLAKAPEREALCFVSADADFSSALDVRSMDDYLIEEWKETKHSEISYYRDIKQFLDDKFQHIRISSDVRKYFLISALIESTNFAESHSLVADLNCYDSFTPEEARRLLNGGMENNQVRWLARDEDVIELLGKVLGPHRTALPKSLTERWDYVMAGRGFAYGPVPTNEDLKQPLSRSEDDPLS